MIDARFDLYVAPADGSTPAVMLSEMTVTATVERVEDVPSAGRVVFHADRDTDGKKELYSVPVDGSSSRVRLNPALIAAGDVDRFSTSADSQLVCFTADWAVDEQREAFLVPVEGPSADAELVNPTLDAGESVTACAFWLVPGGERLLVVVTNTANEITAFYSCPVETDPAGCVQLNPPIGAGIMVPVAVTSAYLAFVQGVPGSDVDLFTVPLDGSAPAEEIDSELWPAAPTYVGFDASERWLVMRVAFSGSTYQLYRTRLDGSQSRPQRVNPTLVAGGAVHAFLFTPDGAGIVYVADQEVNGKDELFISENALIFAADFEEGDLTEWGGS